MPPVILVRVSARRTAPQTRWFKPCAGSGKLVLGQITELVHLQGERQIPGIGCFEVHETQRFLIDPVPLVLRCKKVSCPKMGSRTTYGKTSKRLRRPSHAHFSETQSATTKLNKRSRSQKETTHRQLCHRTTLTLSFHQHRTANISTFRRKSNNHSSHDSRVRLSDIFSAGNHQCPVLCFFVVIRQDPPLFYFSFIISWWTETKCAHNPRLLNCGVHSSWFALPGARNCASCWSLSSKCVPPPHQGVGIVVCVQLPSNIRSRCRSVSCTNAFL